MAYSSIPEVEEVGFPSEFVPTSVKESKEYGIKYFKAVYSRYYNQGGFYSQTNNRYVINRKYAEGLQSVDKYKNLLDMEGDTAYINLDYSIIKVIPKYVDLLVGEMINHKYKIECNAIDPESRTSKDDERNKLKANLELKDFHNMLKAKTGIKTMIPDGEMIPESKEEIDLHMDLNFKQDTEIAMEEALDFVFSNNKWDEVARKIYRDMIVLKRAAARCFYDENHNISIRYVDPVNLILPFTDKDDYEDIKYAGEILQMEIHQLRRLSRGELSEEDLFKIAKSHSNRNGNRAWSYGNSYQRYYNNYGVSNVGSITEYDDFTVSVLDCEFHSIDTNTYVSKTNDFGGFYYEEKKSPGKSKGETTEKGIDNVYAGYWVIGTDYTFSYGKRKDQPRQKTAGAYSPDTDLSFIIYSPDQYDMENASLVERMIPHADNIQIIALKIQNLVAKLTPPGISVDVGALKDVLLGKGRDSASPLELQELYQQTGVYYYNGEGEDGMPMNRQPIKEIKNSIGNALQEMIGLYNYHKQQIRDVTGINELREASSLDKDAPVRTQELSLDASRNSTRVIQGAYLNIYQRAAVMSTLMIQDMSESKNGLEGFFNAIGKNSVEVLKEGNDISMAEFGINVEALPTEEDQVQLNRDIERALQTQDIRLEDSITVRSIPNIKLANQFLVLTKKQYSKEKQEEAAAASQQNALIQKESAMAAAQGDLMKIQAESAAEAEQIKLKAELEDANAQKQHERKMKEIALQNEYKSIHIEQAEEGNFKSTALSKTMPQPKAFTGVGAKPSVAP